MRKLAFLGILLVTACTATPPAPTSQTSSGSVEVRLHAERVSPGTVRLTLDNGASQPIGYNLCSSELQRPSGTSWVRVETGDVCTMEIRALNPGFDATFEKKLPSALPAGEYRYVTSVESPMGGSHMLVATAPFER